MHPYQCSHCNGLFEGACLYLTTTPRDRYGRVLATYRDDPTTPVFESESCRNAYSPKS